MYINYYVLLIIPRAPLPSQVNGVLIHSAIADSLDSMIMSPSSEMDSKIAVLVVVVY